MTKPTIKPKPPQPLTIGSADENTPLDGIMAFKYAWLQLVADAWNDDKFKKLVIKMSASEVRNMFQSRYDVTLPNDFDLTITDSTPGDFWDSKARTWNLTHAAKVSIPIPPKPEKIEDAAVAIASYNDLGKAFPLSCSC